MSRNSSKHRLLPIALTALTAAPLIGAVTSTATSAAGVAAARTRTYKGPVEYVDHGPVQVSIAVRKGKIVAVNVANSAQDGRSVVIQNGAIPILKAETLRAQSANINEVSGATDTSGGYIASLQSAVKKARAAKAMK